MDEREDELRLERLAPHDFAAGRRRGVAGSVLVEANALGICGGGRGVFCALTAQQPT